MGVVDQCHKTKIQNVKVFTHCSAISQEAKTEKAPNSLCSISPGGTAHWWRVGWNHTDIGIMSLLREPRTKDVNSFTDAFLKEGRWEGL